MKFKKFYLLVIFMMVVGSINFATAQELGRKGPRKSRHVVGAALGTRSYLDSDFFEDHPEGLVPGDLRGNSYNIFYESTPPPGLFGAELLLSLESNKTTTETGNDHKIQAVLVRLSGKFHPITLIKSGDFGQYLDFYVGGGITGITFKYEAEGFSQSYKANGPHLVAGFEFYTGTFSDGKWKWGAYFDYFFTPDINIERVGPDKKDFNAGGHLFIFGLKFNAFR
jgi:hypothetical protein